MNDSAEVALDRDVGFELGTEHRFPLDLTSGAPTMWEAYENSLAEVWDPEEETHWVGFDVTDLGADDRAAGALVWSHRAWVEFPAIAESEAVLVRACLETGVNVDLKYCLSMRAVERARSTDLSHMVVARLDRYHDAPATDVLAGLLDGELVRRALHARTDLDAYIAAHLTAQATLDLRVWERAEATAGDTLGSLIGLVVRDKLRMLDVAWQHLAAALPARSDADRTMIAGVIGHVLAEEREGRQLPALLPDGEDRRQLLAAHSRSAEAGLGGVPEAEQTALFSSTLAELRIRFEQHGVTLDSGGIESP